MYLLVYVNTNHIYIERESICIANIETMPPESNRTCQAYKVDGRRESRL